MKVITDNKDLKTVVERLEQLVLNAEKQKKETAEEWGDECPEYFEAEAYEMGVFTAYAIAKKVLNGDWEE